jgi:hypothetical protein
METTVGKCWIIREPGRPKYHRVAELLRVVSQATAELADEFDRTADTLPKKPVRRPRPIAFPQNVNDLDVQAARRALRRAGL